jgi:membrane protease YdiL (CAAX protease family)
MTAAKPSAATLFWCLLPAVLIAGLLAAFPTVWPAFLAYHALCIIAPLANRVSLKDAGFVRGDARSWLPLALGLAVVLVGTSELLRHTLDPRPLLPPGWQQLLARTSPRWLYIAYTLTVNATCEELYWRGFLLPRTGILWGGVAFWSMHVAAGLVLVGPLATLRATLPVLLAGLVWGWMRKRFGSLWPGILTHFAANAAVLGMTSGLSA